MNITRNISTLLFGLSVSVLTVQNVYSEGNPTTTDSTGIAPSIYYRQFTAGATFASYRDFATSPLFYSGVGVQAQNAWLKRSNQRERIFEAGVNYNTVSAYIPKSDFIQPFTGANFVQVNLRYTRLWEVNALSSERNNIKVGGTVNVTQNFRINPSLLNNALGFENISNIMVSGQIIRDISRKEDRKLNLWLIKPTLKAVKRDLRFQCNAGILNFNYRPGYAYSYVDEKNGTKTSLWSEVFAGYKWSLNGWRLNTQLEYITYLPNGNARSWSYVWDAASAPGKHEAFEMASHQIRYTYYFQSKKR